MTNQSTNKWIMSSWFSLFSSKGTLYSPIVNTYCIPIRSNTPPYLPCKFLDVPFVRGCMENPECRNRQSRWNKWILQNYQVCTFIRIVPMATMLPRHGYNSCCGSTMSSRTRETGAPQIATWHGCTSSPSHRLDANSSPTWTVRPVLLLPR